MVEQPYILSFTAASVLREESRRLAELFSELADWQAVRERAIAQNLLQARKASSSTRVCRELVFRLRELGAAEFSLFLEGSAREQNQLLWLAICRRYRLVAEFALEVVRERFLSMGPPLEHADFDAFFNRKADWHEELDQLADVTRRKLRQVLFRMLREVELTTPEGAVMPAVLSQRLIDATGGDRSGELLYFPVHEADLARKGVS